MTTLLSILLVSNNRRSLLEGQVENLLSLLSERTKSKYEIIVSETSSVNPASSERLGSMQPPPHIAYKYIFLAHPFVTAEEHLLARLEMPVGHYCWILGDDDPVVPEGLTELLRALIADSADFILFDSYSLSSDGLIFGSSRRNYFPLGCSHQSMNELIAAYGFWFVPSGFSVTIFKRKLFDIQVYSKHVRISPIYSHVSAFIECFSAARCATFGTALVWYRTNLSDEGQDDNWQRLSRVNGHAQNYPWTLGFSSLLLQLISGRFIHLNTIRFAIDQNHEVRFIWHMLAIEIVIAQCKSDINDEAELYRFGGLYRDSFRESTISWPAFVDFWELVLRGLPVATHFTALLRVYADIVLTVMALNNLPGNVEGLALRGRLNRLHHRFESLVCSVYDLYLAKYLYRPVRFWVEHGSTFGLYMDTSYVGAELENEASLSRNMELLTHSFRGCKNILPK